MEAAQPTLADILGHPLVTLAIGSVIALVGWLLSIQATNILTTIKEHEARLDRAERKLATVWQHLWPTNPSPFKTVSPPREDSA